MVFCSHEGSWATVCGGLWAGTTATPPRRNSPTPKSTPATNNLSFLRALTQHLLLDGQPPAQENQYPKLSKVVTQIEGRQLREEELAPKYLWAGAGCTLQKGRFPCSRGGPAGTTPHSTSPRPTRSGRRSSPGTAMPFCAGPEPNPPGRETCCMSMARVLPLRRMRRRALRHPGQVRVRDGLAQLRPGPLRGYRH